MTEKSFDPSDLLRRYLDGNCTETEMQLVEQWYGSLPENGLDIDEKLIRRDLELVLTRLRHDISVQRPMFIWRRVAAAILLLAVTIGLYLHFSSPKDSIVRNAAAPEISPASQRATLTLADGTIVGLDTAGTGLIALQQGTNVHKAQNGELSYAAAQDIASDVVPALNTVSTPRGGFYKVVLADGSSVWINAASSLRFPTRFARNERRVKLVGEAYFEISKDAKRPFIVESGPQQIRVLGTGFNSRNYEGEPAATTLVHGKVQVSKENSTVKILLPGQQAITSAAGTVVKNVDVEQFTGWKSDLFIFHNTGLRDIMKEIDRWYDVQTDLESLPDEKFYAEIPRTLKLSEALRMLEGTSNVRFKIEGRRIMTR